MSFDTYVKAGMVHVNGDEEISIDDLKKNQKKINGHVSMIIKIFGLGKNWNQESRMRESMLSEALAVCPLWLLFKCHKGWSKESGKVPPTRPVAGGNQGMNFPLSEVISWLLEPLASSMEGSSEVISGEDLRSIIDQLNIDNRKWEPEPDIQGSLDDHEDMLESLRTPRLCACKPGECELEEIPLLPPQVPRDIAKCRMAGTDGGGGGTDDGNDNEYDDSDGAAVGVDNQVPRDIAKCRMAGTGGEGGDTNDGGVDDVDDSNEQVPRDIAKCRMAGTGGELNDTNDEDDDDTDSDKQKCFVSEKPDSMPNSRTDGRPDVLIPSSDSTPPTNAFRRGEVVKEGGGGIMKNIEDSEANITSVELRIMILKIINISI